MGCESPLQAALPAHRLMQMLERGGIVTAPLSASFAPSLLFLRTLAQMQQDNLAVVHPSYCHVFLRSLVLLCIIPDCYPGLLRLRSRFHRGALAG
eukprot:147844-Chlamydomonas_euryale.AAC.2